MARRARTPTAPPAPAARPGCVRRLLRLGGRGTLWLLLGLVVLGLLWVNSEDFQLRARELAEHLVERETGEQLTLTRVRLRLLPPGLEVDGLHLFHAPTGDTIVSVERARIPLVLRRGRPAIGRIALQAPRVELHVEPDGRLREFRQRRQPTGRGNPLRELPFGSLDITGGSLRIHHPQGELALTDLRVEPLGATAHDVLGDLELRWLDYTDQARVMLPDVLIGPDAVVVPHVGLELSALSLAGIAVVPLEGAMDVALTGQLRLDALHGVLPEPRRLHGFLDLDLGLRGTPADPALRVAAWGTHLGLDLPGVATPVLSYELDELTVAATATRTRVDVDDLVARLDQGTVRATGRIDPFARTLVDARAVADRVSLRRLLQAVDAAPNPWIDLLADAEVRARGKLHPLQLTGDFDLAVAQLRVGDRPITAPDVNLTLDLPHAWARGTLALDPTHIVLDVPEVRGPRTQARAWLDIGFAPRGPLDLRAEVHHADLSDFRPLGGAGLAGVGRIGGRIHGPFNALRFEGEGTLDGFEALGLPFADRLEAPVFRSDMKRIELEAAVARKGSSTYQGDFLFDFRAPASMAMALRMKDGRVEDITSVFLDLPGLTGSMSGTLNLEGPVRALDGAGHFTFLDLDLWGERFAIGEGHGMMDGGLFTLDDLRVLRNDRREGLILRGSVGRGWALNMDLVGDGFVLGRLDRLKDAGLPLRGRLGLYAQLGGTLFDPAPRGRALLRDLTWDGEPVEDSAVRFETVDGVLRWRADLAGEAMDVEGTLGLWGERSYQLSAVFDRFPAHVLYPVGADGSPIHAVASGTAQVRGTLGAEAPAEVDAELHAVQVQWGGHELRNRVPWRYRQQGRAFRLEGFDLAGGRTAFTLGATGGDTLELEGQGVADLDLLRALVPGLTRAEGEARVAIHATGQRPAVETVAELTVDAALVRHASVPLAFEDLAATVRLTDDRFDVLDLRAGVGGGTLTGVGRVDAAGWVPSRYDLAVEVEDAAVRWVPSLPPAIGDARLRLDGPVDALLLSGDVTVHDMLFSDRIDWEDQLVEYRSQVLVGPAPVYDEEPAFALDVRIGADRTVRLQNNVAEGTASAELRVVGDTARPGLLGGVRVDEGVAIVQDRVFRIDRGQLTWDDPWTWDPMLDIELITDIESRSRRYRVNYQVFGPFSNWRTASRSDPPLPQADVNALLWFGVTTDDLEQTGELSTALVQGMADLVLTDLFASTQAGELGEVPDLLFDRIDVATGVNGRGEYSSEPRLVVEKRLQDLAGVQLTWEFNLGRPEDNYLRVDKRVGGVWSIAGWYATLQRDRVLPIGGAYGVDFTARWEVD